MLHIFIYALKEAEKLAAEAGHAVDEAQQILNEKQQLVESAKQRFQALKGECAAAYADLAKTKEAETKAIQAAKTAHDNAERDRRKIRE